MVVNNDVIMMIISLIFAVYLIIKINKSKNKNNMMKYYLIINIFLVEYLISLMLQVMFSKAQINPMYFDYFAYIGAILIPIFFFVFSKEFEGKTKYNAKVYFIIPIISLIIIFTSDFHNLFFKKYSTNISDGEYGLYAYIHMAYTYTILFIAFVKIILTSIRKSGFLTIQTALLIVGALAPFISNVLGSLKIISISLYITPIMFTVTSICFYIAIFKLKAFSITPVAFRTVIDTMSDAYIVISDNGTIVDNNLTFHKIFKDVLNSNENDDFFQRLDEKNLIDVPELKKKIIETRKNGNIVTENYHLVVENPKSKNEEDKYLFNKYFEVDIHPIKASRGKEYVGTLLLFKDVTQHMEDMKALEEKQDVIVKQGQLVSIGELAGGVAHDINTPISAIKTGITMLNSFYQPRDEKEKELLDRMDSCADKIIKIVNSMRNQIRNLGSGEKVKFKISDVLKDIQVITYNEITKHKCSLDVNIQDDVSVMGEPTKLSQVFTNLIVNAIQAYPEDKGGKIEVEVSKAPNNKCMIKIRDFAGGIPEEIRNSVFKSILTTKGIQGTGLGLYLAYSVIKGEFSGDITFESETGEGTTFYIVLDRV